MPEWQIRVVDSLRRVIALAYPGKAGDAMKLCTAFRLRSASILAAAVLLAIVICTAVLPCTAGAQDSAGGDSWQEVDRVLVVPPVYPPDSPTAADGCAEDCSNSVNPADPGGSVAVSGTADEPAAKDAQAAEDPAGETVAAGGAADAGPAFPDAQVPDSSQVEADNGIGSIQEYQQQELSDHIAAGPIVQVPQPVIVPAPMAAYSVTGASPPRVSAVVPQPLSNSTAWMPPPIGRPMPLPSIVSRGLPRASVSIPGSSSAGFRGGFGAMSGFRGGFGHR
jgi:hypothetical protein